MHMPCDPLPHYWYSQKVAIQDDARYSYENHSLDVLHYYSITNPADDPDRRTTPFYLESDTHGGLMQQYGCNAASWAMVLKNLGLQGDYLRRDIRHGENPTPEYLPADPFGVTLANTQDFTQHWDSGRRESRRPGNSWPNYVGNVRPRSVGKRQLLGWEDGVGPKE